ncbi:MAG: methionine adenosyltransferase, partial [Victivallales bacterium]|nr:methionine adenosyltransferase [Victivallales bacterium]
MALNIKHFFTSEAVSEGHPDKVCDQISDAILDAAMDFDSHAHVACETLATTDTVVLAGEVNPIPKDLDYEKIVRGVVAKIGYDRPSEGFSDKSLKLQVLLHGQSADIARGVSEDTSLSGEQGAGDQGIMFGFACNETPAYMPAPIYYSHRIVERLAELRHTSPANYGFLRPDAKSQLTFEYEGNTPVAITQAVVSTQHLEGTIDKVRELV